MNVPPPSPSRLLRATAFTARWLMGLLLAGWLVLVASWGILHGWIVPRIADYRPQLEQQATRLLGIPVRIGDIAAQTVGLVPSFSLHDIQFFDRQGQVALRLPTILVALSPRSLWHLGFEQLYIDSPELDIRRAADGRIFVAGLDMGGSAGQDDALQKWFFSQREFVIRKGQIRWTDELRAAAPLALTGVNVLVRNSTRRHALHVDAAVPPEWGSRFSVNARFRQPLLSRNTGNWQDWDGQVFANFDRVDVSRLRQYADLGVDVTQGNGALRFWTDLRRGQVTGVTADVALAEVSARVGVDKAPMGLRAVTGRLGGKRLPKGFELATQGLKFTMPDGREWPGGNIAVVWKEQDGKNPPQGELHADRLDLAALGQLSSLLPLDEATHAAFQSYAPRGLLEKIDGRWRGGDGQPAQYSFKGRVAGLQLAPEVAVPAAVAAGASAPKPGRPGVRGASVDFDLTQAGGTARLAVEQGALTFPGVFEEPEVPMDRLNGEVAWQLNADRIAVQVNRLKFANADAEGEAQIGWRTSDPAKSPARARFPGVLDLQGHLSRADGTRVYRYLPLVLSSAVRDYVHAAVQQGRATGVTFRVRGDLHDLPYRDPRHGEFRIAAMVQDVQFDPVPGKAALTWPALTQLQGELVFERTGMQVKGASGRVEGWPGLQISKADAQIPDLAHSVLQVHGEARGPGAEVLGLLAASPVSDWTSHVLDQATATGQADYRLHLNLPIREIEKSKVQGTVTFAGNDFQLNPDSPAFSRGRGLLSFNETGFALQGVQATLWGGDIRLEGGSPRYGPLGVAAAARGNEPSLLFKAQGTASAEGLRQAHDLGFISRLAQHASGASSYNATLAVRRGVPEITVQSSLQGLALNLPPPLNKPADAVMPLRFEHALYTGPVMAVGPLARQLDQLSLDLGQVGSLVYVRDISEAVPRVLRGGLGIGLLPGEAVPLPNEGVAANINLSEADVDAWETVLSRVAGATPDDDGHAGQSYLPNVLAVRAKSLTLQGHKLQNLVVGGSRQGLTWRANLEADELSGYLEYSQSSSNNAGRLYARLARLLIAPSAATQVEALLSNQPSSIPALDIVVDDLDLRGKKLGRVDIEAVNRAVRLPGRDIAVAESARDWRLNRFNITLPEGQFSATGNWTAVGPTAGEARRTVMNFKLDIADAGGLLARFGMKDLVRRGQGKFEGQVAWTGSPLSLDYPTLDGQFNVNVENGQFLKADPGIAKLLGVLSLQSLPRRLALDFRDVFSEGFAFDFLRGDLRIDHGIAFTNNLQMKGVNAAVLMEGRADIARETQDVKVVVVPEINAGTASLVASVINPVVGLTSFLTQVLLRRPLIEATTQEFHIDGAWADPHIVKVARTPRAVENKAADGKPEVQP